MKEIVKVEVKRTSRVKVRCLNNKKRKRGT